MNILDKIEPRGDMLLVEKDPLPSHVGRIILPEQRKLRPSSGTVMKPGAFSGFDYPKGTLILFGQGAGEEIKIGEEKIWLLHADEVQAIVRERP